MWPPLSALQVRLAEPGRSCKRVCQEEQLICEPSFFQHLNKDKDLARWSLKTANLTFTFWSSELSCVGSPLGGSTAKVCVLTLVARWKAATFFTLTLHSSPLKKPSLSHHQSCSFSAKLVRNCLQVMESNKCITVTSYSNTLAFGSNRVIQRINLFWYLVLF